MTRAESTFSNGLELGELGERVRARRRELGATLDDISERAGVSRSMLSDFERGAKVPTVLVFDRIATALGTTMARLLSDERAARVIVRRRGEQEMAHDPGGWTRRNLSPVVPGFEFDFMHTSLPPGIDAGEFPPHPPGSHSYLVVAEGTLRLTIDGEAHTLQAGDSAYYRGDSRHAFANPTSAGCSYYLANYYHPEAPAGTR